MFVGAGDGSLTGLSTVDGSVESINQYGAAVTGIAAVNEAVYIGDAAGNLIAFTPYGRAPL